MDFFLDNVTGDLYSFSQDANEWVPKVNVGLHYRRAAQDFTSLGKYMIKQPVYKPKPLFDSSTHYLGKSNEDFCNIRKIYLQHWALQGVDFEFKIPFQASWDVHQFNFMNPAKTFYVLAESKAGPQIIHLEPFCIATLFHITRKYPATVQVLKNFVLQKVKELKSMTGYVVNSIEKASVSAKTNSAFFENAFQDTNGGTGANTQGLRRITVVNKGTKTLGSTNQRPQTASSGTFPHSGYAMKQTDRQLIVENNAVRNDPPLDLKRSFEMFMGERPMSGSLMRPSTFTASRLQSATGRRPASNTRSTAFAGQTTKGYEHDLNYSQESLRDFQTRRQYDTQGDQYGLMRQTRSEEGFHKSKAEIRMMLYPEMSKELLPKEEFWVPGNLSTTSKSRPQTASMRKSIKMDTSYSSKFYSRYNKDFKGTNPDEGRDKVPILHKFVVY